MDEEEKLEEQQMADDYKYFQKLLWESACYSERHIGIMKTMENLKKIYREKFPRGANLEDVNLRGYKERI